MSASIPISRMPFHKEKTQRAGANHSLESTKPEHCPSFSLPENLAHLSTLVALKPDCPLWCRGGLPPNNHKSQE
jgi:hypothetical protein